jgi:hypothetical protein
MVEEGIYYSYIYMFRVKTDLELSITTAKTYGGSSRYILRMVVVKLPFRC